MSAKNLVEQDHHAEYSSEWKTTQYAECIERCWSIFSPNYAGRNRIRVEKRCYDRCKNEYLEKTK